MELPKIFTDLQEQIEANTLKLANITEKLKQLELGGGSGNASIEDYQSGKRYKRNALLVYNETVYRVLTEYTSVDFNTDYNGDGNPGSFKLKLVGFESSIVTYGEEPTQEQVNNLPQDTLVAIYSPTDEPYNLT